MILTQYNSCQLIHWCINQFQRFAMNIFKDQVILCNYMLSSLVDYEVVRLFDAALVVFTKACCLHLLIAHVAEDGSQEGCLLQSCCQTLVLSFAEQESHSLLLPKLTTNCSILKPSLEKESVVDRLSSRSRFSLHHFLRESHCLAV